MKRLLILSALGAVFGVGALGAVSASCTPAKSGTDVANDTTSEAGTDWNDPSSSGSGGSGGSAGSGGSGSSGGAAAHSGGSTTSIDSLTDLMDAKLMWGIKISEVNDAYSDADGILDMEYAPVISKMQPGTRMQAVESDLANRKSSLARNVARFQDDPNGFDSTGIRHEFTYKNEESMQWVGRLGMKQYFFYFGAPGSERLWKIYNEIPLKAGGSLGATFQDAVAKLTALLGGTAATPTSPDAGADYPTVSWAGAKTHIRAVDRSSDADPVVGVVFEDQQTLTHLDSLRPNKPEDPFKLDPNTASVTRHGVTDPNAPKDAGAARKH